jgi:hypothetical protein
MEKKFILQMPKALKRIIIMAPHDKQKMYKDLYYKAHKHEHETKLKRARGKGKDSNED